MPLRADKASIDAVVDEPLRIDTNLQTGFYEPLTYDGVPPGVVWNESDLSLEGTPTEVGTFTVTVHDAGNPKFDCPSTSTSFQIVVADKPIECASDNDCEILVNGGATCTESSDCNGSAFDRTCAKLDVGGGRCKGDDGTAIFCGSCTHDLALVSVEGEGYHDCGYGAHGPTCTPRGHCSKGPLTCD
ncbi:MAG TPA: putative Ig domain-containing protein [Polyangiaceae bacterium]